MNIVDYWKNLVKDYKSYEDFGSSETFIEQLNENVPDWRLQVKDKNLWPELHTYSANIAETSYVNVIIREAGLEFAFYLIQNQWKRGLNGVLGLDFCCEHINEWDSFPNFVKEKVLNSTRWLRPYLNECRQNVNIWKSLTEEQKSNIFDNLALNEGKYVSDILLFMLWVRELDCRESPYIIFETDHFRHCSGHMLEEINHYRDRDNHYRGRNRDNRFYEMMIEHCLREWDIPEVVVEFDTILSYRPSEKLRMLKDVAESCDDQTSIGIIDKIIRKIQHRLRWNRLRL